MKSTDKALNYLREYNIFITKIANSTREKCPKMDSEDIKQQLVLSVLTGCDKYVENEFSEFSTYCSTIIINAASTIIRKYYQVKNRANIDCVSLDEYLSDNDEDGTTFIDFISEDENDLLYPDALLEYNEAQKKINEAINNLKPFDKRVLKYFIGGMPVSTIAKKIDKSEKTVYNILARIKKEIKIDLL